MHDFVLAALPWVQALAYLAAPTILGLTAAWFRVWLVKRHYRTDAFDALTRACATGLAASRAKNLPLTSKAGMAIAIEAGLSYWLARVPDKLAAIGITPEDAVEILEAGLKDYELTRVTPPAVLTASSATVVAESAPSKENQP